MRNHHCIILSFFFTVAHLTSFGKSDTTLVNKLNEQALNLAYSDPSEAMKVANRALKLSRQIDFSRGEVRALIRKGIVYDVRNKSDEAIDMYKQSLELSYQTKDQRGIASNLNNLGLIYYKTSQYYSALKYFHRAYAIFKKEKDEYNLASVSNNIGMIHEELQQDNLGVNWFKKALYHYKRAGEKMTINEVYTNLGNLYQNTNSCQKSMYYSRKAIKGYMEQNNKYGAGIALNNLGLAQKVLKQYDEAKKSFLLSIEYGNEVENTFSVVSSTYNLSVLYTFEKDYKTTEELLESLLPKLLEINSNELAYKIYFDLARIKLILGDQQRSMKYLDAYKLSYDKYLKEVMNRDMIELADKFELKEIKQQADFKLKNVQEKRATENLMWAGSFAFVILLIVLLVFVRRKSSLQKELESQMAILKATTEERKRISFDLHDHVGSQLSYVVNNLELLSHLDNSNERISKTFGMSQAAMSSLRDTVWTLHTEEITMESLAQRMENVMYKTLEQQPEIKTDIEFNFDNHEIVPSQITMHLMRIFQESVHNVVKHAKATSLRVSLKKNASADYELCVEDNGIGIQNDLIKPFHYGLQSMKDRTQKINGQLSIESEAGKGTKVKITWKNTPNA